MTAQAERPAADQRSRRPRHPAASTAAGTTGDARRVPIAGRPSSQPRRRPRPAAAHQHAPTTLRCHRAIHASLENPHARVAERRLHPVTPRRQRHRHQRADVHRPRRRAHAHASASGRVAAPPSAALSAGSPRCRSVPESVTASKNWPHACAASRAVGCSTSMPAASSSPDQLTRPAPTGRRPPRTAMLRRELGQPRHQPRRPRPVIHHLHMQQAVRAAPAPRRSPHASRPASHPPRTPPDPPATDRGVQSAPATRPGR